MALKVKRAGGVEYGQWAKILVVGDPGAGKTRTASTWPDVFYASAEGGLMSVADRQPAYVDITKSSDLMELVHVLQQKPEVREQMLGVPVKTLVVDTIDEMARILVKERLESEKKVAMAIADWGWLGEQLRNMVRAMRNLDMHVIFNVHVKTSEDSETGRTYFKPGIQGAMGDEIAAYVDLALFLTARPVNTVENGVNIKKVVRFFQTHPDPQRPWVKDRSGKLPLEFEVNFDDDYDRLIKSIYTNTPAIAEEVESHLPQPQVSSTAAATKKAAPKKAAATRPEPELPEAFPPLEVAKATEEVEASADTPTESGAVEPAKPTAPEQVVEASVEEIVAPEEPAVVETEVAESASESWEKCGECGGKVENKAQADLSNLRFRKNLCRSCFADAKVRK